MGVGICEKHDYCTFIISCEHINNVVEKVDEIKNLNYVTVVEYEHTKFLGFSDKYAYCDECAEKYRLPKGKISQIRLLFTLPFRKKFATENEFYVCDQCFFEDLFDQTLIDYKNNRKFKYPFMNKTEKVIEAKVPKFQKIKEIEESTQVATYAKMNIAVERGRGSWIWTSEGEKFLDLYGGHAVCGTGHSHPHVVEAIKQQADKVLFYSNLVYSEIRAKVSEKLVSVAPDNITKAFFCNSGTEANENAMRMARFATGREKIITFTGGFHGRSADSISATFLGKYREIGKPNVPHHVCAEFGNLESVRELADDQTAAIMLEPIQSMFGCREATPEFFQGLRQICDEHEIILIFDEVQTGVGRTGNWFFSGSENAGAVEADVITLAKSLGSGIPVGACLVNEKVSKNIKTNDLGTTFGGGMLAMAAVLATLEAIENEDMIANAKRVENHLRKRLKEVEEVVAIHGKGCLIGIEFSSEAKAYHAKLLENKIITGTSSVPNILRLLPPLCVKEEEIDSLIEVLS